MSFFSFLRLIFFAGVLLPVLIFSFLKGNTSTTNILHKQERGYVKLTVLQVLNQDTDNLKNKNIDKNAIKIIFRFNIRSPYHINSGSPLIKGLIPTTVTVDGVNTPLSIIKTTYPPDEILDISGFRTTVYYKGPHDIQLTLKPKSKLKATEQKITATYTFYYQACQDDECYAPGQIKGNISIDLEEKESIFSWIKKIFSTELLWIILFAFLGGLILNFTPCVLPILSLKLLSLSAMKDTENVFKKKFAFFYIMGALSFFLLIATSLVILKNSGEQIGWGIQFQSPYYVFFIILVLTIVSLNLLGVYEIRFSYQSEYPKKSYGENAKNFGTGFLSVLLATPCTVPFLGIAVAYSLSQGTLVIFLFHIFVALGFVFPYALIFVGIDISHLIPRLRPAQKYIKKIFGFIIILTIIWLIDVYGALGKRTGVFNLLIVIWFTTLLLWIYGETQKRISQIKFDLGFWIAAVFLWTILIVWIPKINLSTEKTSYLSNLSVSNTIENGKPNLKKRSSDTLEKSILKWEKFSKKKLEVEIASSKIVFVHFTADWCLNCKVNEKLVLETEEIISLFDQYKVVLLKADWTQSNEEIFNEIQSLNRAGIPLDVFYYKNKKIVLSTLLTKGEVKSALKEITQ